MEWGFIQWWFAILLGFGFFATAATFLQNPIVRAINIGLVILNFSLLYNCGLWG